MYARICNCLSSLPNTRRCHYLWCHLQCWYRKYGSRRIINTSFRKKVYEEKQYFIYFYFIAMYWFTVWNHLLYGRFEVRCGIWTNGSFYLSSSLLHDSGSLFSLPYWEKWELPKKVLILSLLGGMFLLGWLSSFANTYIHDLLGFFSQIVHF